MLFPSRRWYYVIKLFNTKPDMLEVAATASNFDVLTYILLCIFSLLIVVIIVAKDHLHSRPFTKGRGCIRLESSIVHVCHLPTKK